MNIPNIRYYAIFDNSTAKGKKTPKYSLVASAGYYEPMEQLRGKDGQISMYLTEKLKEENNVPSMRLQAKDSLNFTGLKEYFIGGKLSGYAYGYPFDKPAYSKAQKPNPFFEYKQDCFLFKFHTDDNNTGNMTPIGFEMIVLEGAKVLASSYCKMLVMGGFDDVLKDLREQASRNINEE